MDDVPTSLSAREGWASARLSGDISRGRADGSSQLVSWLRRLLGAAGLVYPLVVYYGLTHWRTRPMALGATAFFVALITIRGRSEHAAYGKLVAPAMLAVLAGFAFVLDADRLMLALPVAINLALLAVFSSSLGLGVPVVERFARLQSRDLGEAEVLYCRRVTVVWCVFFTGNAFTAGAIALFAPLSWWALYTGIVSYVLMGLVFAIEYSVRIYLFPAARPFGGYYSRNYG